AEIVLQSDLEHAKDLAVHIVLGCSEKQKGADNPTKIPGSRWLRFRTGKSRLFRDAGRIHYWFTPLAKNPPSTASTCPVTKLAASDAKNTAAPTNSSTSPKRPMGVRARNSLERGEPPVTSERLSSVINTPGAIAFTHTPCFAHSIAKDLVKEATAALLAEYAATS